MTLDTELPPCHYTFKILLVGDSGVGKTCLLTRFTSDQYDGNVDATVGVDFGTKQLLIEDTDVKLTVWDTAGQERFRTLTSTFYRGAAGVIYVFDVTRRKTLESLEKSWMDEVDQHSTEADIVKMIVANKVDMREARQVTWEEGRNIARNLGCMYVETSAKNNIAVGNAFEELVLKILDTPSLVERAEAENGTSGVVHLDGCSDVDSLVYSPCYC